MSYLGVAPTALERELARLAADPASTRNDTVRRRPDAMVTPGLEVARAFMDPRPKRRDSSLPLLALLAIGLVAAGSR